MMVVAGHVSVGGNHAPKSDNTTDSPARTSGSPHPRRYARHQVSGT
jgi:hypothetical protein